MTNEASTGPDTQAPARGAESPANPPISLDPTADRVGFPAGEVRYLRTVLDDDVIENGGYVLPESLAAVLNWIDRYVPRSRPDMELSLGDDVGTLTIEDPDLEVELIRFNGRTFVPEAPTLEPEPITIAGVKDLIDRADAWPAGPGDTLSAVDVGALLDEMARMMERLAGELITAQSNRFDLLTIVRECGAEFRSYERRHRAKVLPERGERDTGNLEATRKADHNRDMARLCEGAIAELEKLATGVRRNLADEGQGALATLGTLTAAEFRTHGPESAVDDEAPIVDARAIRGETVRKAVAAGTFSISGSVVGTVTSFGFVGTPPHVQACDEVFGTAGPGPFPPTTGLTRGGRSMPVSHSEEAAVDVGLTSGRAGADLSGERS
jgi:hypothetical protein